MALAHTQLPILVAERVELGRAARRAAKLFCDGLLAGKRPSCRRFGYIRNGRVRQ